MKLLPINALMIILMLTSPAVMAAEKRVFSWPKGAKAAVSIAYDDALDSQLDHAIPALNKYGLKGSFYLTLASDTVSRRLADWRAAATGGHELANHTLFHLCSRSRPGRDWVLEHRDLDQVTVAQLMDHIKLGNSMLHAIDGKTERTFTTPCGDLNAAGESYIAAATSEFVAMKTNFDFNGVVQDMNTLDLHGVPFAAPSGVSGKQLIALVEEAAQRGTMANITFHGVGAEHLAVSKEAHEELLKYLSENQDIYWTDTFINIMKYVKEVRATK